MAYIINSGSGKTHRKTLLLKDTHREKTPSNKTSALAKSMNMDIWVAGTSNQLFIAGSYTKAKFQKK